MPTLSFMNSSVIHVSIYVAHCNHKQYGISLQ